MKKKLPLPDDSPGRLPGRVGGARLIQVALALAVLGLFLWRAGDALGPDPRISDSREYLAQASNLARLGILGSANRGPGGQVLPSCNRLPGYPAFLALGMHLFPHLLDLSPDQAAQAPLIQLKYLQLGALLITALAGGVAGALVAGSVWAGLACFALVSLHPLNLHWAGWLLAENLTGLVIMLFSLSLVLLIRWPRAWLALICGLLLGCLGLTRGVFFHFWPVGAVFIAWAAWGKGWGFKKGLGLALCLLLSFWLLAAPWLVRNHQLFGRWVVSQRGGIVLALRAAYDQMTPREMVGSFYAWTPWYRAQKLVKHLFYPKYFDDADLRNLDYDNPQGYRRSVYARWDRLMDKHGDDWFKAEDEMGAAAKKAILSHPWRHLAVTASLFNRGIWVGEGRWYFLAFVGFWGLAIWSLFRKRHDIQALLVPACFCYAVHSLATHNLPRYTVPLWPVFLVADVVSLFLLARWLLGRRRPAGSLSK